MHHVHRQIHVSDAWRPLVLAQKVENIATFPTPALEVVPRSGLRFFSRARERHLGGGPWQISRGEATRLNEKLRAHGACALHVFFGNVAVHLRPWLERLEVPLVVSFHGADVTGPIASDASRRAREVVFARAHRVVCRSAALAESVAALGCPTGKLEVVRTALPELPVRTREREGDKSFHVVQACRLIPKKGLSTSLRAIAQLRPRFPGLRFTIAGSGPLEPRLRSEAAELGIADQVTFAGFLSQADLRGLFDSAHAFLHPSETVDGDVEGVPNALLEAMASGLPVVATRHGGIAEAVIDGETGLLVGEGDAEAVAGALGRLMTDAPFAARLAVAGADSVRRQFSRAAVAAQLERIYLGSPSV